MDSETFGIEKGHGNEAIRWINEYVKKQNLKLEVRLYGDDLITENFGDYELFSWRGDVKIARKLIIKVSKRLKIKVIEGGYKTKERTFHLKKLDYVMVRKGDKVIGQLELEAPRFGSGEWKIIEEARR
jgi:hypothetical protein